MIKLIILLLFTINTFALCIQPIFNSEKINPHTKIIDITADNSTIENGVYDLSGNISVNSSDYYLSADDAVIDSNNKKYTITGNVKTRVKDILISSDVLYLNDNNGIKVDAENLQYQDLNNNYKGQAKLINIDNTDKILTDASYSTCNLIDPNWRITANKIIIDDNLGSAHGAVFWFFGIPLFYTPYYNWAIKGRKSGFLTPKINSYSVNNERGYDINIPYYINIAPDKDLTINLRNITTRGRFIDSEYRQLFDNDAYLKLNFDYLNKDNKTNDRRWAINSKYNAKFNKVSVDAVINRVSDNKYFSEIDHITTEIENLKSAINVGYKDSDFVVNLSHENEQKITGKHKYTKDLEVAIAKKIAHNGFDYDANIVVTNFGNKDKTKITGRRNYAGVTINKNITGSYYNINPSLNLSTVHYDTSDSKKHNRSMYGVNIDAQMLFENNSTNLFGNKLIQKLEPRFAYFYNPDEDQSDLPIFDSELVDSLSYDYLFYNSVWSGIDRIAAANNIALGVAYDLISYETGHSYLTTKIGRNINIDSKNKSNIFYELDVNYGNLSFYNSLEYDNKVVKRNLTTKYSYNDGNFVTIGNHLDDDNEYLSASASIATSRSSHVFAGIKYAIDEDLANKQIIGFFRENCCFGLRIFYKRAYNDDINEHDSQTHFEFIFKGLGSSNDNLYNDIKNEIPEYTGNIN